MPTNRVQKRKIEDYSKDELLELVRDLKKRKKYGLVWEAKPEEVVEQCKRELPVLEEVGSRTITEVPDGPTNLIIEGDNYHALSVLNYTHAGKVDVIYIDPPYNTGARDWKYNNDYVDINDTYRHSKWIGLMHSRLLLARNLLKDDGIICVTIDDYEVAPLVLLMEEVFGEENHLGTVVIKNNPAGRSTEKGFSVAHESSAGSSHLSSLDLGCIA
jgi:adenine-specific DNA-methyltransferase